MKTFFTIIALLSYTQMIAQSYNKILRYGFNTANDSLYVHDAEMDETGIINFKKTNWGQKDYFTDRPFSNAGFVTKSNGEALLRCNGIAIVTMQGDTIVNGDSICATNTGLYNLNLDSDAVSPCLFIPPLIEGGASWMISRTMEINMDDLQAPPIHYLFLHKIKVNEEQPRFSEVLEKGKIIYSGSDFVDLNTLLVKHGNGRDWWILANLYKYAETSEEALTGKVARFLLTPEGIADSTILQVLPEGSDFAPWVANKNYSVSPDGSKIAIKNLRDENNIILQVIFDFDRCTGDFTNPRTVSTYSVNDQEAQTPRVCSSVFSPNSRFFYCGNFENLYQYDTWATDIASSGILVGSYDGYIFPDSILSTSVIATHLEWCGFSVSYQGISNKIYYISSRNHFLHTIENPDALGVDCNVIFRDIDLIALYPEYEESNFILHYDPNYQLHDFADSPCDTLGIDGWFGATDTKETAALQNWAAVYPNPLYDNEVQVALPADAPQGVVFEIYDLSGLKVQQFVTQPGAQTLVLRELPNGTYNYRFMHNKQILGLGQLVVVK